MLFDVPAPICPAFPGVWTGVKWLGFDPLTIPGDATDLVELLRLRAERYPHERAFTFLVDGESQRRHINYGQLDAAARAIAADLLSRKLTGERALLLYPSGLEFVSAFFGCLYAGVVAVPAYPPRRNRNLSRIQSMVKDASPAIALTTAETWGRIEPMIHDQPELLAMPWVSTDTLDPTRCDAWRRPKISPSTLAFLQYTSGSTGTPKGVMLSHNNLLSNTKCISTAFKPTAGGQGVTWLPLYHDMGLIGGVIQPIYFARPITLLTPMHFLQKPLRWLQAVSDTGAVISGGPNFAYELCVERITDEEAASLDLSQWAVAFNGAEPVRAETMDRFSKKFACSGFRPEAFMPCYGLAESTLMVAATEKFELPVTRSYATRALQQGVALPATDSGSESSSAITLVSSGRPTEGQNVLIVDPDTLHEQPERSIGEVWVAGPSVAEGYWKRPEVSAETFAARTADGRGPYLRTGDLGFLDGGELFISGRSKDLIIINGANHYPQDIELTVEQAHPFLPPASGAAFGAGELGREGLVIVHEAGRQRGVDFEEVFAAVRQAIAQVHEVAPQAIVLVKPTSIPKTSSGKIQRHVCLASYQEGTLSIVAQWTPLDGVVVYDRRALTTAGATGGGSRGKETTSGSSSSNGSAPSNGSAHSNGSVHPNGSDHTVKLETTGYPAAESNGSESNGHAAIDASQVVSKVLRIVRQVAKERAQGLTLDSDIAALGLDSLERMEIVAGLEDEFGGRFPEEAVLGIETCRDAVDAVEKHLVGSTTNRALRTIRPGDYQFAQSPEYQKLAENIRMGEAAGFGNPFFTQHEGVTNDRTRIAGREYVNWCSYNYLGMSGDPAVTAAVQEAVARFGSSVSASRLVSGEKTIHRVLEREIADLIGAEDAIVMVGGHATNETVIGHLLGPGDLILHDALAHNSIVQGCRLSGALRRAFPHNDAATCGALLERYRGEHRRVLVVVEGVYSMDGDYPHLPDFADLKKRHRCTLMVDEAHSLGTMGETGRGMREHFDLDPADVDIWMGTMSKSLGSCGGYIAGCKELVKYLKYTAPGFVYSVGLSPPNTAAALAALNQLKSQPERVAKLRENSELFLRLAQRAGLNTGTSGGTPIIPIILGNSVLAIRLSRMLFERGINVQPILYPAVEEAAARLRFFITSNHSTQQVTDTVAALAACYAEATRGTTPSKAAALA